MITTSLAGAQIFVATNGPKNTVTTTMWVIIVHSLPMEAAHAQKERRGVTKVRFILLHVLQRKLNFISLVSDISFRLWYSLSDLDNNLAGWCTDICCDDETKETCYDYRSDTVTCALIADGGCSCPKGTVRCGLGKMLLFLVLESYELHFTYI